MKRPVPTLFVILALISAACSGDAGTSTTLTAGDGGSSSTVSGDSSDCETVEARASHHISDVSAGHVGMQAMADEVAELTDGRITIEIFPSGQLGGLVENAESLRTGAIDIALADSSSLSQPMPEMGALDLPFIFATQQEFNDLLDGEFGEYLNQRLVDEVGVVPLYWSSVGLRNIFLAPDAPEVQGPADLEGVTLRIPDAPVYQQTFDLLGATTVVVDAGELYTSVQTGIVDGFEFPLGTAVDFSMYEVVDKMAESGHIHTNILIAASGSFIDSLCQQDEEALMTAAQTGQEVTREGWVSDNEAAVLTLAEEGIQSISVDRQAFIDAVAPMYEDFTAEVGSELFDRMQEGLGR